MKGKVFEVDWRCVRYVPGLEVHYVARGTSQVCHQSVSFLQFPVFRSLQHQIPLIITTITTELPGSFQFIKDSLVGGYFYFRMMFQNTKKEGNLLDTIRLIGGSSLLLYMKILIKFHYDTWRSTTFCKYSR